MQIDKKEWKSAYHERLIDNGIAAKLADKMADAYDPADVDLRKDPADVADDELGCWIE